MIIPMPAEYLDQLYTEIGLLFLISLFLLILFLCTVIRFHTKKKTFSEHDSQIRKLNEQLQTLASERNQLRSEANDYQNQIRQMDLKIQEYEDQFKLQDIQRQEYIDRHSIISSDVYNSPSKYYYFTKSCMNANESLMYYYINYILKEILPASEFSNYYIFPQVSIYSFIKVHSSLEQDESEYASRNYWAKSIDFVICYCHKADRQYLYTPVLLMELDGSSHFSSAKYGTKTFRRQQENDRFKDSLFSDLNIPLIRFQIPDNHLTRKDLPRLRLLLSKYFPRQSQNK